MDPLLDLTRYSTSTLAAPCTCTEDGDTGGEGICSIGFCIYLAKMYLSILAETSRVGRGSSALSGDRLRMGKSLWELLKMIPTWIQVGSACGN